MSVATATTGIKTLGTTLVTGGGQKDRPSTTITMRVPADVVESLKAVAPMHGFTAYQTLLKSYITEDCVATRPSTISTRLTAWRTRLSVGALRRSC